MGHFLEYIQNKQINEVWPFSSSGTQISAVQKYRQPSSMGIQRTGAVPKGYAQQVQKQLGADTKYPNYDASQARMLQQLGSQSGPIYQAMDNLKQVKDFLGKVKTTDGKSWKDTNPQMMKNLDQMVNYLNTMNQAMQKSATGSPQYQQTPGQAMQQASQATPAEFSPAQAMQSMDQPQLRSRIAQRGGRPLPVAQAIQ